MVSFPAAGDYTVALRVANPDAQAKQATVTVGNADGRAWWDWFILGVVARE